MTDCGVMGKSMVKGLTLSLLGQSTKGFGRMEKNTVTEHSPGPTGTSMVENGMWEKFMGKAPPFIQMGINISENGKKVKSMVKVIWNMVMIHMKVIGWVINNMDMVFIDMIILMVLIINI